MHMHMHMHIMHMHIMFMFMFHVHVSTAAYVSTAQPQKQPGSTRLLRQHEKNALHSKSTHRGEVHSISNQLQARRFYQEMRCHLSLRQEVASSASEA